MIFKIKKGRLLSALLAIAMIVTLMPITVFAAEPLTLLSAGVTSDGGVGLTFNKELSTTDIVNKVKAGFTITGLEETPKTITNVTIHSVSGGTNNFVQLYLNPTVKGGEAAGLSYMPGDVQAADGGMLAEIASMDIENNTPHPDLVTTAPPAATVGSGYTHTFTASGGTGPYTFSVDGGNLPSGLTMSSTGVISGTPTVTASFTFFIMVEDANQAVDIEGFNITVSPPTDKVCEIGGTQYTTLDAALATIAAGEAKTITLLKSIDYDKGIFLDNKKVTFVLNGYTLNINNPEEGGFGLAVQQGGAVYLSGNGALNATGETYGVRISANVLSTQATVTSATATGPTGEAAYAAGPATLTVLEDATVTGVNAYGAHAISKAVIDIKGNVNATNQGVYASDSIIKVAGNVKAAGLNILNEPVGIGVGVYGKTGVVTIGGNITANRVGAMARAGGNITIDGTLTAPAYIQFADDEPTAIGGYLETTTKSGYRTYQKESVGTVWIKDETPPAPVTYALTVTSGTGGGSYAEGMVATITANAAPSGQSFKEWSISPSVTFAEGTTKTSQMAKINMPAQSVTATAIYESLPAAEYMITVQTDGNGMASANISSAAEGAEITLTATPGSGYRFKEWQVISGGVTIANNKFSMLDSNVMVKAIFEPIPTVSYNVTVNSGTASSATAAAGAMITITANSAPSGERFKEWSITPSVTFADSTNKTSQTAKIIMPSQPVAATAIYEVLPVSEYTITVQNDGNGTASANFNSAAEGAEITLTAMPGSGYRFKEWQVISGGVTIVNNKFSMLDSNVTIKAFFEPIPASTHTVTFILNGGTRTGGGELTQTVPSGGSATAPTTTRSDYTFTGWDKAFTNVTSNLTVTATWSYNGGGGSSSGGSGSGGSSFSDDNTTTPATITPEKKPDQPVTAAASVTATAGQNGAASASIPDKAITDAIAKAQADAKAQGKTANGTSVALNVTMPQGATS